MFIFAHFSILVWLLINVTHYKCINLSDKKGFANDANTNIHNVITMYNLDPLYESEIEGQTSDLKYMLSDVYLYGTKDCMATQLVFDTKQKTFQEQLNCPAFRLKFKFVINHEDLQNEDGEIEISTGQYTITWMSTYIENKRGGKTYLKMGEPMIQAKTVDAVTVKDIDQENEEEVEEEADIEPEATNISSGKDQEKIKQLTNNIIEKMLEQLYDKLNVYISMTPIDQLLTKNKSGMKTLMKKIMGSNSYA